MKRRVGALFMALTLAMTSIVSYADELTVDTYAEQSTEVSTEAVTETAPDTEPQYEEPVAEEPAAEEIPAGETYEEPAAEEPAEELAAEPAAEEPAEEPAEEVIEDSEEEEETEEETEEESETESEEESDPNADVETAADWEATLPSLTGVWGDDIVRVAQSQLGYTESTRNFEKVEDATVEPGSETASKKKGYTRYGAWYGSPYADWCAMFASFCLYYAGVPTSVMPEDSGVVSWIQTLQGAGIYADKSTAYQPVSGDLIFFAMGSQGADHVGIIESTVTATDENGKSYVTGIYTIEGNSGNAVRENYYDVSDSRILGYGVLNGQSGIDEETASEWEETIPTLTGELANDVTLVAESQLGYTESKRNFSLSSDWSKKGYTRYGAWYGNPYEDWSTMFVSFCLTYADSGLVAAGSASALIDVMKEADLFEDADYVPSAGDVVFLSKEGDGADASAIIERVDTALDENGDEVVSALAVIEGDSNDAVREATYFSANGNIAGYAKIAGEKWDGFFDPEHPEWGGILVADIDGELGGTVTADIPAGAFDETVTLTAEAAVYAPEDADSELLDAVLSAAGKTEDDNIYGLYVINITFISEDGEEVEPAAAVSIAVDTSKAPVDVSAGKANKETLQKSIYHISKESGAANAVGNVVSMDDDNRMTGMAFDSEAFSPFVLLLSDEDDGAEPLAEGDVYSVTYSANNSVVEFPDDNPMTVADGGTLEFSVIVPDGYAFDSVTANGTVLAAEKSEDIEGGAKYQQWYEYSGANADVTVEVEVHKGQVIDGYGEIEVTDQLTEDKYTVTIKDVPTNTSISLSYADIDITDKDGNLIGVTLTGSLYFVPTGSEDTVDEWQLVSYFELNGSKSTRTEKDDDENTITYYEVVAYSADGKAFDLTTGSLWLRNTTIISARADIMPIQTNTLCELDDENYTQTLDGATEMSSNPQTYYYPGLVGDVIEMTDLTNGKVETFYYGSLGSTDEYGYKDTEDLTEFESAQIVKEDTTNDAGTTIYEYYIYPLDKDGSVVEDYDSLYMEYDQVYSFDVEYESMVNEHTEDNGDVYLWMGTQYYVDKYHNQGTTTSNYTNTVPASGMGEDDLGIWVQLANLREPLINKGTDFSIYENVTRAQAATEGVTSGIIDKVNANYNYGIAGPYTVDTDATKVQTYTARVTGHVGDEFVASDVFGTEIVYMVTDASQLHETEWVDLGAHASDTGTRAWWYWINDYYQLNNYQDELEFLEIAEREDKTTGETMVRLEADEMGASGLGEEYDVWNTDLITKRDSVVETDLMTNQSKYTADGVGFSSIAGLPHHVQLRMNGTFETVDPETGETYFGKLTVLADEDDNGNLGAKAPYIEYSIPAVYSDGTSAGTVTGSSYIKMENEQEANSLAFTDEYGDNVYVPMEDMFDTSKVVISVRINFTGTITSSGGEEVVYTSENPYTYEGTLTEAQLREAYDTCPNNAGYDFAVNLSEALQSEIETNTEIILYKIWDDSMNVYSSRGTVEDIVVTLERSEDGTEWETVLRDMDDPTSDAKEFTISAPIDAETKEKDLTASQWSLVLDEEDLGCSLTYTTADNQKAYYQFRIASEKFGDDEDLTEGFRYETTISGTSVTNKLNLDNISISGEKKWMDTDGKTELTSDQIPVDSVIITLYQDGHYYNRTTVGNDTNWAFEFDDLPLLNGTVPYEYTLGEMLEDGTSVSDGDSVLLGNDWFHFEILANTDEEGTPDGTYSFANVKNPVPEKDEDSDGDGEYGDTGKGVQVGDTITYKIDYENYYSTVSTVKITDVLDEGLDFVKASDGGTYDESTRTIKWVLEDVGGKAKGSVTFEATVNETALVRNEVDNTAEVQVGDDPAVETNTVYNPVPDKDVDADGDGVYEDSGMLTTVGATLVYKIDYENPDDEAATVTITDTLDVGLDFVEATDGGTYDEGTITWVIPDVAAHTNGSVYFTAIVNENATVAGYVENTAYVQVGEHDAQRTKTVYNPVPGKGVDTNNDGEYDDNGESLQVGDTVAYEITYYNGYKTAATVTITDVLDIGLDFVSADNGGTYDEDSRTITWAISNVEPLTGGSVSFTATVNEDALVKNVVDNTATVQIGDDPETAIETNETHNPVPDKDVDANGDEVYEDSGMLTSVGATLVYKIDYENPDDEAATVTITDVVDVGLDFVSATDNGSYDDGSRTITWVIEGVAPHTNGSVYFTATVNENATVKGYVENTAVVQVGNHDAQQTKTVYNPVPGKGVDTNEDGEYDDNGESLQVGDEVTYEITYFNGYKDPATVTITDVLDIGLDFVEASDGGTYDAATRTITWEIEGVEPHTNGRVYFTATVNENALERNVVDNTAMVKIDNNPEWVVDTNPTHNPVPDKDVDADGDEVFEDSGMQTSVGATLVYKISYENPDDDPATVTITDELDIGLDFVEASDGGTYDEVTRTVTWVLEDVASGTKDIVTFTVTVNSNATVKGYVDNTAVVQVGEHDAQQTKTVWNPLESTKDVDVDNDGSYGDTGESTQVGDTLTYIITYSNGSAKDTAKVTITDELDEGLDYVEDSASDGGVYDESTRTITWEIEDVDPQTVGSVTFKAVVNEKALVENVVDNTAKVQVNDNPAVETNTTHNPVPDKDVDANGDEVYEDSGMQVNVGGTLVYKIDYENPDDEAATVTITDEVDVGLDFVSATDSGSYDEDERLITWVIEDVAPHTNGSVYFTATVNETALEKNVVENTATVQVGNHAEQQTKTVWNPLGDVKDVDADGDGSYGDTGTGVQVGDTLTYVIAYLNDQADTATVTITDVLDEGLDFVEASDGGTYDEGTRTITWTITEVKSLTGGSVTFKATVNETALVKNEVENSAKVQAGDNPDYAVDTNPVYNPVPDKDVDADGDGEYKDSGMQVNVGDTLVYKIDYENPDDEAATVTITDEVDIGLDFVSATDEGSYDEGSRMITWTIEGVEGHTNGSVYFTATVNEDAQIKNYVENTATVQVGEHDAQQTKTVYNPVPSKDVDADNDGKEGDSGEDVHVGDTLTYTINFFNGYDVEEEVFIHDVLDLGLDYVSSDPEAMVSTDADGHTVLDWDIEGVEAHTAGSVTFKATVNDSGLHEDEIKNEASVEIRNYSVVTNMVDNPVPDKDVDVHGDDTFGDSGIGVEVGQTLTYIIDYFNGYDEPQDIIITDTLDPNLEYVSSDPEAEFDGSTLTWTIEGVEGQTGGTVRFQATVLEGALVTNEVENTAYVKVGDDPAVSTNTVYNPVPDKDVDADGDGEYGDSGMQVDVGDTLTYRIDYENPYDEAADITITDVLDVGLDFNSASDGGTYSSGNRTITWVISGVAPHTNGSVTFEATVNEDALVENVVKNTATVQVGNNPEQQTRTVWNPLEPEKDVDIHGDGSYGDDDQQVSVGDTLTYKIDYYNDAKSTATVTVTDVLDIGLTYVSSDPEATYDPSTRTLTWVLEADAEELGSVTFKATVNENALEYNEVENTATVQIGDDPDTAYKTNTVENPVPDKDVDVNLDDDKYYGDDGVLVGVGQTLTYKISYKNTYEEAADVKITDALDKNVEYVSGSASDGGSYNPLTHTVTWTIKDVPAGTSGTVTFQVVVKDGALTPGKVENSAKVQVGNGPEIETNKVVNPVEPEEEPVKYDDADGDGDFNDDLQEVAVGDEITYKITYKNHHGVAETVTITDALDKNVQFVSASAGGVYDSSSHTVTWTLKNVPAFESGYVTFTVRVLESAVTPGNVYNTAKVQIGNDKAVQTNQVVNPVEPPETETPGTTPGTTTTPGTGTTTTSVKTADDTPIELMVFLMAAALMLLALCAGYTYRRRRADR